MDYSSRPLSLMQKSNGLSVNADIRSYFALREVTPLYKRRVGRRFRHKSFTTDVPLLWLAVSALKVLFLSLCLTPSEANA